MWSFFKFLMDKIKKKFVVTAEKIEASIMFVSLREKDLLDLEIERLVILLNEYVNMVTKIICKFEGIIVKYIANEVFVIFRYGEHQKLACEAIIEIIKKFEDWRKTSFATKDLSSLDIAIGANVGEVIASTGRNFWAKKPLWDVWGKNVNVAERLQKECLNYGKKNLVSNSLYLSVENIISAEEIDEILINDKKMKVYSLLTKKFEEKME